MIKLLSAAVMVGAMLPQLLWAQESIHSDWLELVVGHKGKSLGAEMRDVEVDPTGEGRTITIAIPKAAIKDLDDIEEVVVVGRRPQKIQPLIDFSYKWVKDYDNDYYGLVIHLSEGSKWPIRLYMNSEAGFVR